MKHKRTRRRIQRRPRAHRLIEHSQQEGQHAVWIHFVPARMHCQLCPVRNAEESIALRDVAEGDAAQQRRKLITGLTFAELALQAHGAMSA